MKVQRQWQAGSSSSRERESERRWSVVAIFPFACPQNRNGRSCEKYKLDKQYGHSGFIAFDLITAFN